MLLFGAFLFASTLLAAQEGSVYKIHKPLDVPLFGLSAGFWIGSQFYQEQQEALWNENDLADFNRNNVNAFDRSATYNYNENARATSDIFLRAAFVLPATLMLDKNLRKDALVFALMYVEVGFSTAAVTEWSKVLVRRARPIVYNDEVSVEERIDKEATYSFFSGHSSMTTALLFFTAKVIHDNSNSRWLKRGAWAGAGLYSGYTAWLRVEAGKHFPTDVIAGMLVGGAFGVLIPQWHKKNDERNALMPYFNNGASGITWVRRF